MKILHEHVYETGISTPVDKVMPISNAIECPSLDNGTAIPE